MKKFILILSIIFLTQYTKAQLIPKFQFGIKAGTNLSKISEQNGFNSSNRAGYLFGIWARAGAMGLHLQPELYYTVKTSEIKDSNGQSGTVDYTSMDLPILVGTKIGAAGIGARLNTGPVVSFKINEDQSIGDALNKVEKFKYKEQAFAWQFGAGIDIKKISIDLRYEQGLSKIIRSGFEDTKLNLFNFSIAYRIY